MKLSQMKQTCGLRRGCVISWRGCVRKLVLKCQNLHLKYSITTIGIWNEHVTNLPYYDTYFITIWANVMNVRSYIQWTLWLIEHQHVKAQTYHIYFMILYIQWYFTCCEMLRNTMNLSELNLHLHVPITCQVVILSNMGSLLLRNDILIKTNRI